MSPSDLGEHLKPFVFLDLFEADMRGLAGSMPVHPPSGTHPFHATVADGPVPRQRIIEGDVAVGEHRDRHDTRMRMTWMAVLGEWQRDWARDKTAAGVAGVVAEHGGGSGVAFAWEMQLLASHASTGR
jgi:hypothetical protein